MPFGCQTVLVSVKVRHRVGPGSCVQSVRTTGARRRASASRRRPPRGRLTRPSTPTAPVRSSALTSTCDGQPRRDLGRPAGDDVDHASRARRTSPAPPTGSPRAVGGSRGQHHRRVAGYEHRREHATRPSSDDSCGARTATTPVGSGVRQVEVRPGDGVGVAGHLRHLVGPAGVPDPAGRSRSRRPSRPADGSGPRPRSTSSTNCDRRSSISSATRYSTWPRLYAVRPDQPGNALRAAITASRASLRDARAALATNFPLLSVTS